MKESGSFVFDQKEKGKNGKEKRNRMRFYVEIIFTVEPRTTYHRTMNAASDISNLKTSADMNSPFATSVLMIRASKHDLLIAVRLRCSDILNLKIW